MIVEVVVQTNLAAAAPPAKLAYNAEPAKSVAEAAGQHESVLEPKYDGWRLIFVVGDDGVARGYTRTGNSVAGKLPAIEAELAKLPPGTVLDCEVVKFEMKDGVLVPKWGVVQSILGSGQAKAALCSGSLTLVVFDMLAHGSVDARPLPFKTRRKYLEQVFANADFDSRVILTPQLPAEEHSHDALVDAGYEGSVVKWLDAPYRSGKRGAGWFKLKPQATVDAIIAGYKEGTPGSSFDGLVGAIVFSQYDGEGNLVERGRCSGMDWDERVAISANREAHLGKVVEVAHMGVMDPTPDTPYGAFRHPQFKSFREDKSPEEVTIHDA